MSQVAGSCDTNIVIFVVAVVISSSCFDVRALQEQQKSIKAKEFKTI